MTDRHDDAVRDLVQRAHHSDPEPAEFDIQAGLADVFTRSAQQVPSRAQPAVGATRPSVQADPILSRLRQRVAELAMNRGPRYESVQPSNDSIGVGLPLLRRRWARRRAPALQLRRQATYQALAWRVEDMLVGCGLSQAGFSIGGGRVFHIPQVVLVVPGPPVGLNIRMLPGQVPDDFAQHARRIAYNLDVAEVRVIPLGEHLVRLELVPKPAGSAPTT
jgi:hypothetical protein